MKTYKFSPPVESALLFLFAFLTVQILVNMAKGAAALWFGIDLQLQGFNLNGVSKAESVVWTYTSVRIFYSIEVGLTFLIFLFTTLKSIGFKTKSSFQTRLFLYLSFASFIIFSSSVIAGILTKNEFFHALNWFMVPYSVMLISAIVVFVLSLLWMWYLKDFFLFFLPQYDVIEYGQYVLHFGKNIVLPFIAVLVMLFLPGANQKPDYSLIEGGMMLLLILAGLMNVWRTRELEPFKFISVNLRPMLLFVVLIYLVYVVVSLIHHLG